MKFPLPTGLPAPFCLTLFGITAFLLPACTAPEVEDAAEPTPVPAETSIPENWTRYHNQEFSFELRHPPGWKVSESYEIGERPVINLYPPEANPDLPLTQHSEHDVSHVSIFPRGGGTEGVIGTTAGTNLTLPSSIEVKEAMNYLLADGVPWATMITFQNTPFTWNQFGFLWATVAIDNFSIECFREGDKIPMEQCEPLFGDDLVRHGSVDQVVWQTERKIVSSLRLLDRDTEAATVSEMIRLEYPRPDELISSPLKIQGEARGSWFFEGSFTVRLLDADGGQLISVSAKAQGEWTTEDFLAFEATLKFAPPSSERGTLILERANPSGLPENEGQLKIPVRFRKD